MPEEAPTLAPPTGPAPAPERTRAHAGETGRIAHATALMVGSQLLTTPVSMLASAVLARRLGPPDFGAFYLAQTGVVLAFLLAEWGQSTVIAGAVARDRALAAPLLGTSVAVKVLLGAVAMAALVTHSHAQGYAAAARTAVLFLSVSALASALQASGAAVLRGFERIVQVSVIALVANLGSNVLAMGAALAGGGLVGVLWSNVIAAAAPLVPTFILIRRAGVGVLRVDRGQLRALFGEGSGFLLFSLVLALQPYVDAAFISRLAPGDPMGWLAASRRIAGVLVFPAASLSFAMYPTLARLHKEAPEREAALVRSSVRLMLLVGAPVALGTFLFAAPIVHLIYGAGRYDPVVLNLQLLAPWIPLVYFSIIVGGSLLATGRVVAWSLVQALCVAVSVAADAPLIHLFSARLGNGAAGVTFASLLSELLMVIIGAAMLRRSLRRGRLPRTLLQTTLAGVAMTAVALGLGLLGAPALVGAPAAVAGYAAVLWAQGVFGEREFQDVFGIVRAKLRR